jgi:sortase A
MKVFAPADDVSTSAADEVDAAMPARQDDLSRLLTKWEVVGVSMTGVGVLLLLFFVYLYAFTPLTAIRNQHRLLQSLTGQPTAVFKLTNGRVPADGHPVAVLDIPALGEKQVVVSGTSPADLQQGPGLLAHSAVPGEPGNAVIAGRRVTYGGPFGRLASVAPGDLIHVVDGAGTFTFRSVKTELVPLGGRIRVASAHNAWLTLVTANSSVHPNAQTVVVAKLMGRPAVAVRSSEVGSPSVHLSFGGDQAAGWLALAWAAVFLFIVGCTLLAVRRWRQPWVTYLLSAPLLLACGLFVCENVARCLPATL